MPRSRAVALAGLAAAVAAVAALRRRARVRAHVDLYFDDGSMVSFAGGSPAAERFLATAARALAAVRA